MPTEITTAALAKLMETDAAFALIDVREHGEYNPAHIAGSSSVRHCRAIRSARSRPTPPPPPPASVRPSRSCQ